MGHIVIATPHLGPPETAFTKSLFQTQFPKGFSMSWDNLPGLPVDDARNRLAKFFLQHPRQPSHLLFVDADAVWSPMSVVRLMERDVAMVCACMYTRSLPPTPTPSRYMGRSKAGRDIFGFAETIQTILDYCERNEVDTGVENAVIFPKREGDLYEVDGMGMHFTLIRRDVIEAVDDPRFIMSGPTGSGEDFYFSKKVKAAGFRMYMDLSLHTAQDLGRGLDFGLREMLAFWLHKGFDIIDEEGKWELELPA